MRHDLRHAVRAIAHAKAVAAVLLLSLGLGTGVNAAVHGALDALLFDPPPGVDDPAALVGVYTSELGGSAFGLSSFPDFRSIAESGTFASMAAIDDGSTDNVRAGGRGATVRVAQVTDAFFSTLGMTPVQGTLDLRPQDDTDAAVLSADLAAQLGGADRVVGQTLAIGDRTYVIAGVTPPRFRGLQIGRECDVWILMARRSESRGERRLELVARLAPAGTAAPTLEHLSSTLAERHPATNRGSIVDPTAPRRFTAVPLSRLDPATAAQTSLLAAVIGGASTLLLAAACLNVGGLLLSWSVSRRHELAVKMALGAQRSTLVRQLLTETICLSLAGGALGLLFAAWTGRAIPALFMVEQAAQLDLQLDVRAFLLTVGIAIVAGVVFGVAPAIHGTAAPPVTALRANLGLAQPGGGGRLRTLLVTGQVALSTFLLLTTGLLVNSLDRALQGDLASTVERVVIISMELPGRFHDEPRGAAQRNLLISQLAKITGVSGVAWASELPLQRGRRGRFQVEGSSADVTDTREFDVNVISPNYFDVLGLRRIEGRTFGPEDTGVSDAVVVVDEILARGHFGSSAVGNHLIDAKGRRLEIVGVVQSGRYRTLQQPPQPTVYYVMSQEYLWQGHLVIRTADDPAPLLESLRYAADMTGSGSTIRRTGTLRARLEEALTLDRLTTTLVGACGLIALAMSTLGVYGIMMDAVQRRTREIGLRVALGAAPRHVAGLVFLEAAYPAVSGLVLGAIAALAVGRAAQSMLHGVPPADLALLGAAAASLTLVILIAGVLPLQRALRVHPNIALRAE
jgi:putative ABC transport system permease protein